MARQSRKQQVSHLINKWIPSDLINNLIPDQSDRANKTNHSITSNASQRNIDKKIPQRRVPITQTRKAVFISHEGQNKIFANNLFDELQNRNLTTFFDQDKESLPLAEQFPDKIIEGLRGCEVVVFLLSESFVTKKWPMIELVEAYRHFKEMKRPLLLPLFYNLRAGDISESKNKNGWEKWSKEWETMESTFTTSSNEKITITATDCREALKFISSLGGLPKGSQSEHNFMKTVADEICRRVKPDIWGTNDMLHHKKLSKVVKDQFGQIAEGPKLLGMWGEKNSGKSKLSNALCSHYFKEYNGIVQSVELAFESQSILKEVKKILQSLTNADWRLLDAITSLDLAINYFKERIGGKRFFLAIDNIPGNEACRIGIRDLWVAIRSSNCVGSCVLLTARDPQHLESFLKECGCSTQPIEVPQLQVQEAIDILVSFATNSKDGWDKFDENQKTAIQDLCQRPPIYNTMSKNYSPGEAKSVGLLIGGSKKKIVNDPLQWQSILEAYCSRNLNQLFSQSIQRTLERAFRDNAKVQQALLIIIDAALYEKAMGPTLSGIWRWLGIVHDITGTSVKRKFNEFKEYQLIDWNKDEEKQDAETLDVRTVFIWPGFAFPKFAKAEAREKPGKWRWFYYDGRNPEEAPENVEPEKIEKMALVWGDFKDVAEVVSLRWCVGVVAFMMARCAAVERLNVRSMKQELQVLEIENCVGLKKIKGVEEAKQLERLYVNYAPNWVPTNSILDLSALKSLRTVRLINTGMENPPKISGCPDLHELYIERNHKLKSLPELGSDLGSLSHISFADNPKITILPDLSLLAPSLTHLSVRNCAALTNIKTLDSLTSLKCLNISSCKQLRSPLPDLSNLKKNCCYKLQVSAYGLHPRTIKEWKNKGPDANDLGNADMLGSNDPEYDSDA